MTGPTPPFLPSARPPVASGTNTMAVLAIVFAFLLAPLGIVFGAIGRSQIVKTGQKGKGLATAGLVLGIVFTLIGAAAIVVAVVVGGKDTAVSKSSMEKGISEQLVAAGAPRPESVSCPGSLRAEVGTSLVCTVTTAGQSSKVAATVTSVSGSTVRFTTKLAR